MQPDKVLQALGEHTYSEDVPLKWDTSMSTYHRNHAGFPLYDDLENALNYCNIDLEIFPELMSVALQIQNSEPLRRISWHCRRE